MLILSSVATGNAQFPALGQPTRSWGTRLTFTKERRVLENGRPGGGQGQAELRLIDVHGRELRTERLMAGQGILEFQTTNWVDGIYLAELRVDGIKMGQTKLVVQH